MAVKVYLKGVTVFIDDGTTIKRIPSGYVTYDVRQGNVYIHNLIDSSSKTFPIADLQDESGAAQAQTDDYLSAFIGSFKNGGSSGEGLQGSNFWEAILNDTTTAYIYKGGLNGTDWQINRYDRSDNLAKTSATVSNNSGITTLTDAWTDRLTINYL